jgi:hypothetical protein
MGRPRGDQATLSPTWSLALGVILTLLGLTVLPIASATIYSNGLSLPGLLELIVYSSFFVMIVGLIIAFWSLQNLIDSVSFSGEDRSKESWLAKLRLITRDPSSRKVRFVSMITYGTILSLLSGILVIQPGQNYSSLYRVAIPSSTFAVCCGSIGQMPQVVLYLLNNVGLVLTPLALVLLFTISWLVGVNASGALLAYRTRAVREDRTLLATIGSFLGIFSICPSCAQGALAALLGTSGVVFVTLLGSYQPIFIEATIPILVISLLWTANSLSKTSATSCALSTRKTEIR